MQVGATEIAFLAFIKGLQVLEGLFLESVNV
jgi:hypothetical protein